MSRPVRRWGGAVLLCVAGLSGTGCRRGLLDAPDLSVASVTVVPNPATVAVGGTVVLGAILRTAADFPLPTKGVAWSSSDPTTAVVSNGVVTGLAAGSVTITATADGVAGTATVNVVTPTDPTGLTVAVSTYLGGSAFEHARDVVTDAAGNSYIVGGTMSLNFPTTPGAFQRARGGPPAQSGTNPMDAFVMKLSPGGQLIWSTYLGGPNYDRAYGVEVDAQGYVYVAGRAGAGFPVTAGAFQTTFRGGQEAVIYGAQDGFICKLRPDGGALVYCSYFGTADPQAIRDVAIDGQGNAYLAASARQDGLPGTWFANAFQKTRAGGSDGVIAKVNASGTQVLWATYLGGPSDEGNGENSIRVAPNGNVYFLQNTSSAGLPTTAGADGSLGGAADLYLAILSPDGRSLVGATYIGGSGGEFVETHGLALDAAGNACVALTTSSTDFPTTPGAFQRTYGGSGGSGTGSGTNYPFDAAVAKLTPGGALLAATYLGGRNGDGAEGIGVDTQGNVYVTGGTFSSDFPATTSPFQNRSGGADVFAAKLAPDLGLLQHSQRIGGSGFDVGRGAHADAAGNLYVVGETQSSNFPTWAALQGSAGGNADAFFLKLIPGSGN